MRRLFIAFILSSVFVPIGTSAQFTGLDGFQYDVGATSISGGGLIVPVGDATANVGQEKQTTFQRLANAFERAWDEKWKILDETAAIAYRTGVRTLLSTIANDVGEWLGSGAKGQFPLFEEDQFDDYLLDVADSASGAVIDTLLADGFLGGFNVCEPDFDVALRINLGIAGYAPPAVNCKFSTLRQNWEREIREDNFLADFQASFNVNQNDIGAALVLQNNLITLQNQKKEAAYGARITGEGFKDVTSLISDRIRTPAQTVKSTEEATTNSLFAGELQNTGNIVADSVDIFLSAVSRSFLTNLLKNGLGGGGGSTSSRADLFNSAAQGQTEGVAAARARLAQSINPSFNVPGRYNVVSQLVECTDAANPGHNNCVIDDNFATAINRRLTIRQAVDEGLMRGDRPFGYTGWDPQLIEPAVSEGIPYRSILILRTYRIIPVGWELAARYIGSFARERVTLNQLMNDYDKPESPYYGLVNPDWVLVPPDAFCKLAGPGEEVTFATTVPGTDANNDGDFDDVGDVKPRWEVQREASYCADEQTCIKKDDSGACEFYGYCLEERPSLEFNGASCEARFSTCTTLENLETGSTHSYLLNTVDFAGCSIGSVGCQQYATWQRLDVAAESDIRWDLDRADASPVLLNNQTEACDPNDSGCHAFIRVAGLSDSQERYSEIDVTLQTLTDKDATNDQPFAGATSTLHIQKAPEWLGCRGCQAAAVGNGGDPTVVDIEDVTIVSSWQAGCPANETRWPCDDGSVSAEELEQVNIAFQQGTCSGECLNYAPFCTAQEVGCTAYTPTNGNPAVTAISGESCPNECVGFDVYTKAPSFFDPKVTLAPFIPSTARSCSVSEAGCTAFTNLSKEGQGGEAREYYKQIRYCQLPEQGDAETYYSWEGSDETGYQLRTFELKATNVSSLIAFNGARDTVGVPKEDDDAAPCTNIEWNEDGSNASCTDNHLTVRWRECNANNYQQNTDCRQFYNKDGKVSYRLLSRTISVSEQCSPLRRTNNNAPTTEQQEACESSNGFWNTGLNACIYQAIPGEGQSCRAEVAGCRMYQGGTSANFQTILFEDYETDGGDFAGGQLSSVSADVGGHSYSFDQGNGDDASTDITLSAGQSTTQSGLQTAFGSYLVSFDAKRANSGVSRVSVELYLQGSSLRIPIDFIDVDSTWRTYNLEPVDLTGVGGDLTNRGPFKITLNIEENADTIHIDNFEVQTSVDTFAVVENSWSTPTSCYADFADVDDDGQEPYLGCQTYNLSSGGSQDIWKFGPTCRPEAVSCEALIDTQNLTTGEYPHSDRDFGSVTVAADNVEYIVNRSEYQCNGTVQGCMLLGQANVDAVTENVSWTSANLINNPDRYGSILCDQEDIGCSSYSNGSTTYYFKDPQNKVCEYRTDKPSIGWYQRNSTSSEPDCQAGNYQRNFAPGADGQGPVQGWVGLCPATENSCTEYIDPRSDGQVNILENGRFISKSSRENNGYQIPRSWTIIGEELFDASGDQAVITGEAPGQGIRVRTSRADDRTIGLAQSQVKFEPKTLYVLSADVANGGNESTRAFAGITNCSFEEIRVQNVYCPAIGGTESAPPATVTTTIRDAAQANVGIGCDSPDTNFVNGVCAGDLNNDGIVEVSELLSINSMLPAIGTVQPSCGGTEPSFFSSPDKGLFVGSRDNLEGDTTLVMGNMIKPGDKEERLSSRIYFNTFAPVRCDVVIGLEGIMDEGEQNGDGVTDGGHWFREVSLRRANSYYQLANRVDKTSCGGSVNNADCVLLNERSVNVSNFVEGQIYVEAVRGYSVSNLDADGTTSGAPESALRADDYGVCNQETNLCEGLPGVPACTTNADCQLHYDSNAVVKVTPTRECSIWLSCRTSRTIVENGVTKQVCLDVESCEQINERGECVRNAPSPLPGNLTFNKSTVSRLANLSGYTTAGFDWGDGNIVPGNLAPFSMQEDGTVARIVNGDFEVLAHNGEPVGWIGWNDGTRMKVVADPVEAQDINVSYPAQGRAFLQVNADAYVPTSSTLVNVSQPISVASAQLYMLSASLNTKHFTGEKVQVKVLEYESSDAPSIAEQVILEQGETANWQRVTGVFETDSDTRFVRIQLSWLPYVSDSGDSNNETATGFWYVDDIKLTPGLQTKSQGTCVGKAGLFAGQGVCSNDLTRICQILDNQANGDNSGCPVVREAQSCRLYPTEGAPACTYTNDSGIEVTGKSGYCLVRDPQNTNFCIQWWPVDSVIGENLYADRAGYSGSAPLYQCLDTLDGWVTVVRPYKNATNNQISGHSDEADVSSLFQVWRGGGGLQGLESVASKINITYSPHPSIAGLDIPDAPPTDNLVGDALFRKNEYLVFDLFRAADRKTGGYAIGGLADKPGNCHPVTGGQGCEIKVWLETGGSTDNTDIYVSNNPSPFGATRVLEWKDNTALTVVDGENVTLIGNIWIDLAWASDSNGNKLSGPFRYLILQKVSGGKEPMEMEGLWVRPVFSCNVITQIVSSDGQSVPFSSRITDGSGYRIVTDDGTSEVTSGTWIPYEECVNYGRLGIRCSTRWRYEINTNIETLDPSLHDALVYEQSEIQAPFGAVSPPAPVDQPTGWDSFASIAGNQPVFPFVSIGETNSGFVDAGNPLSCRILNIWEGNRPTDLLNDPICSSPSHLLGDIIATSSFSTETLAQRAADERGLAVLEELYAKTYGTWEWGRQCVQGKTGQMCTTDTDCTLPRLEAERPARPDGTIPPPVVIPEVPGVCGNDYQYVLSTDEKLTLTEPNQRCVVDQVRTHSHCGFGPQVTSVVLNQSEVEYIGNVALTFTTQVDVDQLPIVSYTIDWGDGYKTKESGLALQNRSSLENGISLSHNYSFDTIRDYCNNGGGCSGGVGELIEYQDTPQGERYIVTPRVQIIDNWGWCNGNGEASTVGGFHVSGTNGVQSDDCSIINDRAWTSGDSVVVKP